MIELWGRYVLQMPSAVESKAERRPSSTAQALKDPLNPAIYYGQVQAFVIIRKDEVSCKDRQRSYLSSYPSKLKR
jgi:hypothetical protein